MCKSNSKQTANLIKIALFFIILFITGIYADSQVITFTDNWGREPLFNIVSATEGGVEIIFSMHQMVIEETEIDGTIMNAYSSPGFFLPNEAGAPNLAGTGRYIAIPKGAKAEVTILDSRTEIYHGIEVAPGPNERYLSDNTTSWSYTKNNDIYNIDANYPESPVRLSDPMQIRGVDVVILNIVPFQYNPINKELIIYKDIRVKVNFIGGNGHFGDDRLRSRFWEPILQKNLLNYSLLPQIDFYAQDRILNRDGCEYIIIVPNDPIFEQWGNVIKDWRIKQGISCEVFNLDEIGGSGVNNIASFLRNAYQNWGTPPVAFLILSDYPSSGFCGITSYLYSYDDNQYISPSDNFYADIDYDNLPEMFYGRICARNESQLSTMINKFLNYELHPYNDNYFYDHPLLVGIWETSKWCQLLLEVVRGFFMQGLNKEPYREYTSTSPNTDIYPGAPWSNAPNTEAVVNYFHNIGWLADLTNPYTHDWWRNGSTQGITNNINAGTFMVTYMDHGIESGWEHPDYHNVDLNNLTNTKLPFIYSFACKTGMYNWANTCFAESIHRIEHGAWGINAAGNAAKAYATEVYAWGNYDGLWSQFAPDYPAHDLVGNGILVPAMAMCFGKYFLQAHSNWISNQDYIIITYNIFHHHGDVFTPLYSEMPMNLTVTHASKIVEGTTIFNITANDGSIISLTVNGQIISCIQGTGSPIDIPIEPQQNGSVITVTVTKPNYYRYESVVTVVKPLDPFVIKNFQQGDVTINRICKVEQSGGVPWAVGDCGQVFKLDQTGNLVSRFTLNAAYNLTGISFENQSTGYIVGYKRDNVPPNTKWQGVIWRTTNAGEIWIPLTAPNIIGNLPIPFLNVAASTGGIIWVSCGHGYVLYGTTDQQGIVTWRVTSKPGSIYFENHYGWLWGLDVDQSNPNNAWVCSDQTRLISQTTDGGITWHDYMPIEEDKVVYRDIDCRNGVLIAMSNGKMARYYNGSWSFYSPFGSEQTQQSFNGTLALTDGWGVGSGGILGSLYSKHLYSRKYDLYDIDCVRSPGIPSATKYYIVGSNATIIYGSEPPEEGYVAPDLEDSPDWSINVTDHPNDHGWAVDISWPVVADVDCYKIYCKPKCDANIKDFPEFFCVGITTNTNFTYDTVLTGQKVDFRVNAYRNGNSIRQASKRNCISIDNVSPPTVTGFNGRIDTQGDFLELWWNPIPQTGDDPDSYEPNLVGYEIKITGIQNPQAHDLLENMAPILSTDRLFNINQSWRGQFIYCYVRALDRSGNHSSNWTEFGPIYIPKNIYVHDACGDFSTAFSQGRHLIRIPNTKNIYMTFQDKEKIYLSLSSDEGENWTIQEINNGFYPCLGINYKGFPWIAYIMNGDLVCQMMREDSSWKTITIFDGDETHWAGPPSMVLATMPIKEGLVDYAYITYPVYEGTMPNSPGPQPPQNTHSYIYVSLFDTTDVNKVNCLIDEGDENTPLSHPCVCVTPADLIHIVWQQKDEIWYVTNKDTITPENWQEVQWTPKYNLSNTSEVSEHPFVESYGDVIYVVWKQGDPGEIIRKQRYAWEPSEYGKWKDPETLSNSPKMNSDFPQMSTGEVTLWQEKSENGNNYVCANICGKIMSLTPDTNNISYVHTNALVIDPKAPEIQVYYCYTDEITENELYEVKFDKYLFPEGIPGEQNEVKYYDGLVGDEVASPYCETRTGYIDYGDYKIDYGTNLDYLLKYLDPCKNYLFQAIVYQDTTGTIRQRLEVEDTLAATMRASPEIPETINIFISPNSYKEDLASALEIIKIRGAFAALADFKIYEYEVINDSGTGGGGGQQSAGTQNLPIPTILQTPKPNPFNNHTTIRFQIPAKTKVDLKVYNSTGRLVNTLVNSEMNPGYYTMSWNGKDDISRTQGNGIYFIQLKTKDYDVTKKMVLVK
jgi:hypothetical protein